MSGFFKKAGNAVKGLFDRVYIVNYDEVIPAMLGNK